MHAIDTIRTALREYVAVRNLQTLVIPLYGDMDSSLVAALCQEKYTGVPLLGVIPAGSIQPGFMENRARWAGEEFCSMYESINTANLITRGENAINHEIETKYAEYIDDPSEASFSWKFQSATFADIARKTNGVVLGDDSWTDTFATFMTSAAIPPEYFPIQSIGGGFEVPAFARYLGIREVMITTSPYFLDEIVVATPQEIDVIINGHMGNMDDNLTTQLQRFYKLPRVESVLARYGLNNAFKGDKCVKRFLLGLTEQYNY